MNCNEVNVPKDSTLQYAIRRGRYLTAYRGLAESALRAGQLALARLYQSQHDLQWAYEKSKMKTYDVSRQMAGTARRDAWLRATQQSRVTAAEPPPVDPN